MSIVNTCLESIREMRLNTTFCVMFTFIMVLVWGIYIIYLTKSTKKDRGRNDIVRR